jgi:hypothetical protein
MVERALGESAGRPGRLVERRGVRVPPCLPDLVRRRDPVPELWLSRRSCFPLVGPCMFVHYYPLTLWSVQSLRRLSPKPLNRHMLHAPLPLSLNLWINGGSEEPLLLKR